MVFMQFLNFVIDNVIQNNYCKNKILKPTGISKIGYSIIIVIYLFLLYIKSVLDKNIEKKPTIVNHLVNCIQIINDTITLSKKNLKCFKRLK